MRSVSRCAALRLSLRLLCALWIGLVCHGAWTPAAVYAQAPEPLRMTLFNASLSGGERVHEQLKDLLAENPNVQLIEDEDLAPKLEDYALSMKLLRKGDQRQKHQSRLRRMLRAQSLEGFFVVDVFSRGRKLQVVVIGPDGQELADIQRALQGGKLSRKEALEVLQEAFGALGPEVLAYREANPASPAQADSPGDPTPGDDQLQAQLAPPSAAAQTLERGLELGVGVFVGRRDMSTTQGDSPQDFRLQHSSPFVGAGARVDALALTFEQGQAALGVSLFGAYAQFKTIFYDVDTNLRQELSSSFSRVGAEALYQRAFGPRFLGDLYAGAELISLTIARNAFYTGNRYASGRAGLGLGLRLGDEARLRVHGGLLPVFSADNSGGAFGPSPLSVGLEAGARFSFALTERLFVQINYTFERLTPEYPEPTATIGVPTSSSDLLHTGHLMLGLSL